MPDSGATLLDAIVEISKGLAEARGGSRRDGGAHHGEHRVQHRHYSDVLEGLARAARCCTRRAARLAAGTSLDEAARNRAFVLDRGPHESGGTRTDVLASQAFEGKLKELAAILKSQHRVVYARPQTLIPPQKIEVTSAKAGVEANGGQARGQAAR